MPRMFPPQGAQELKHGGRPVTDDGIDVPELEVKDLLADGWSLAEPIAAPRTIADELADIATHGLIEEEPQS
jgi:hypothetical protein